MNILSFGCSMIFGTDLADCIPAGQSQRASTMTWPAIIASKIGSAYQCRSHGGSGNLCILNRVLDSLCAGHSGLYIIGWTFIDRFDYSDPDGMHFDGMCCVVACAA
jgi:hypothetical protein